MKGFGGKSKQKAQRTDSIAQRLHKHEYEVDERSKNEQENVKNSALAKGMVETPRGSWASRYILFFQVKYNLSLLFANGYTDVAYKE